MSCTECKGKGYITLLTTTVPCLACGGAVPEKLVIDDRYPLDLGFRGVQPLTAKVAAHIGHPGPPDNPFNIRVGDDIVEALRKNGFQAHMWQGSNPAYLFESYCRCPVDGLTYRIRLHSGSCLPSNNYWAWVDPCTMLTWFKEIT